MELDESRRLQQYHLCGRGEPGAEVDCWQISHCFYLLSAWDNDGLSMFNRNLWPSEWYLKDSMMHIITKHSSWLVLIWSLEDSAPSDWYFLKMLLSPYSSARVQRQYRPQEYLRNWFCLRMYELYSSYPFSCLCLISLSCFPFRRMQK